MLHLLKITSIICELSESDSIRLKMLCIPWMERYLRSGMRTPCKQITYIDIESQFNDFYTISDTGMFFLHNITHKKNFLINFHVFNLASGFGFVKLLGGLR